jgi:hypothetical protein
MIDPALEHARPAAGAGFGDAVTFAFGDPVHNLYGSARLGLVPGEPPRASGLAVLFRDGEVAAIDGSGGIELTGAADWTAVEAGDVRATITEPLRAWEVAYDGDEGGFELHFAALGEPAELGAGALAASAADLHGYEQLCRVTGTVRHGEQHWQVACLGQRGHQWGAPNWERIELARTVAAWLDDDTALALASVRPAGAAGHDAEALTACLLEQGRVTPVADPRLSTAVDGDGRQRRAGLELWVAEDSPAPHRLAGEAVCGTTLELGRLRLDTAFFRWRMNGREGVGRYDVLRRA